MVDDPTGTPINKKVSVTNFINNLPSFIGFSNSVEDIADGTQTAVSVSTYSYFFQTQGSNATTLADGTVVGQLKVIINNQDGGASVCTPADPLGYADINFVDDGDVVICMWTGTSWGVIGQHDGADSGLVDITTNNTWGYFYPHLLLKKGALTWV